MLWACTSRQTRWIELPWGRARRRLYLNNNRIRRIENLNALQSLEVLWLSDNSICDIEALGPLTRLSELNLASNP